MRIVSKGLDELFHTIVICRMSHDPVTSPDVQTYFLLKVFNCFGFGNSPKTRRKATSIKVDFSARVAIGYPLYSKMPLSPSMYDIREIYCKLALIVYAVDSVHVGRVERPRDVTVFILYLAEIRGVDGTILDLELVCFAYLVK